MKRAIAVSSIALLLLSLVPTKVLAHCPLCVGGAGAAAALASFLGLKFGTIGVLIGGFAVALSLLIANRLPQKFKYQKVVVAWAIYLTTLIPVYPLLKGDVTPWFVSISGELGSPLNQTYLIDMFIVGSILGSLIVLYSMKLSMYITRRRGGKTVRLQGLMLTFALLIIAAIGMQLWPR